MENKSRTPDINVEDSNDDSQDINVDVVDPDQNNENQEIDVETVDTDQNSVMVEPKYTSE